MHNKKIIEILNDGRIHLSCELFPPKQGAELQNSLEIVNRIAAVKPSYMSVTYGAGGSTVGYSAALAKEVQDNGLPALAHLTCVKADEVKIIEVLHQLQGHQQGAGDAVEQEVGDGCAGVGGVAEQLEIDKTLGGA